MRYSFDYEVQRPPHDSADNEASRPEVTINSRIQDLPGVMILTYYAGGIGGALIGAGLASTFRKNIIYVSKRTLKRDILFDV